MTPRDDIDRKMKTKVQIDMFSKIGMLQNNNIEENSFIPLYEGNLI